ncbi:AAA family ATPase [Pedobacter panaciterrae]
MEYFNIIQALCRSALSNPSNATIHQIERLRDAFEKNGLTKEAKSLSGLLSTANSTFDMAPSRIQKSFIKWQGEKITSKTQIPVDKETSTPLAEIFFVEDLPADLPIFSENVKTAIESIVVEWKEFDKLADLNAQPSNTCLIYGSPGTGKTHLAKWLAKQIGLPVVLVRLDGLMSSFLGTTSRNIGNLFSFAAKHQCVLLLDEFDAIAKLRNDPQEVGEIKRVVNTLLQNLDSRKGIGFTIGVTNHESLLDPAIWRRFEVQLEIPRPSPEIMPGILKTFLSPIDLDEVELKFLSWCIEGASGADAQMLAKWFKRAYILDKESNLVSLIRRFALLNSGRIESKRRNIIAHADEELKSSLLNDDKYSFKQKDVALLFGITPSQLSKQLSKLKEIDKI